MYQSAKIRLVTRPLAFSTRRLLVTLTKAILVTWWRRNLNPPHLVDGFCITSATLLPASRAGRVDSNYLDVNLDPVVL